MPAMCMMESKRGYMLRLPGAYFRHCSEHGVLRWDKMLFHVTPVVALNGVWLLFLC